MNRSDIGCSSKANPKQHLKQDIEGAEEVPEDLSKYQSPDTSMWSVKDVQKRLTVAQL